MLIMRKLHSIIIGDGIVEFNVPQANAPADITVALAFFIGLNWKIIVDNKASMADIMVAIDRSGAAKAP